VDTDERINRLAQKEVNMDEVLRLHMTVQNSARS